MKLEFPLRGAGGEPVDLWRTINSHGVASLPPMRIDENARTLTITLSLNGAKPVAVTVRGGRRGYGVIEAPRVTARIRQTVEHVLRLDEDLSPFYEMIADDPDLS